MTRISDFVAKKNKRHRDTEKAVERDLKGLGRNDKRVYKQLAKQSHIANNTFIETLNEFEEWVNDFEVYRDMKITDKSINVIKTFSSLTSSLIAKEEFLLDVLAKYLRKIKKLNRNIEELKKRKVVTRQEVKDEDIIGEVKEGKEVEKDGKKVLKFKNLKERNRWVYHKKKEGKSNKWIGKQIGKHPSLISKIYYKYKKIVKKKLQRFKGKKPKKDKETGKFVETKQKKTEKKPKSLNEQNSGENHENERKNEKKEKNQMGEK